MHQIKGMIAKISLIVLSLVSLSSFFFLKGRNYDRIKQITIIQGLVGLLFCYLGINGIITDIFNIQQREINTVLWTSSLIINLLYTTLGFLHGCGMISAFVFFTHEDSRYKGIQQMRKIAVLQGDAGLIGLITGSILIVFM